MGTKNSCLMNVNGASYFSQTTYIVKSDLILYLYCSYHTCIYVVHSLCLFNLKNYSKISYFLLKCYPVITIYFIPFKQKPQFASDSNMENTIDL